MALSNATGCPPRLSVVITAYNEGEELRRTIDSVRAGTQQSYEIIVVDDGSTDGSCAGIEADDVRVVRHDQRVGVAPSRNDACAAALGEVFAFLDAHQRISPGCLDQCADIADARLAIVWPDVRGLEDRGWTGHGARLCLCGKHGFVSGEYKSIRPRVDAALRWMTEHIPAAALLGKRGLDVGTRDGYAVEVFRRLGIAEAGGIELVPETAAYAARRGRAVRQGDMRRLPDPDECWDLVTCIHCLEHCPEPGRAIGEMARVLRPGGWLFLVVPREPGGDSDPLHNWACPSAATLQHLVLAHAQFDPATVRHDTGVLARGCRELRLLVQKRKRNALAECCGA